MSKANKSPTKTFTPAELKNKVETAVHQAKIDGLESVSLHGVRKMPNGSLRLQTQVERHAELLLLHSDRWLCLFEPAAAIERKLFTVIANFVPTSFDPKAPGACLAIQVANQAAIPRPDMVSSVRWLKDPQTHTAPKLHSSLVIMLTDEKAADSLIYHQLSLCGALCNVEKFSPPPSQCYHCQRFGHVAKACPDIANPLRLKCAWCAGNHSTKSCQCPDPKTKCSSLRTCRHVNLSCANCGGPHKSFDNKCPVKSQALAAIASRQRSSSPYFNPSFMTRAAGTARV